MSKEEIKKLHAKVNKLEDQIGLLMANVNTLNENLNIHQHRIVLTSTLAHVDEQVRSDYRERLRQNVEGESDANSGDNKQEG